MLLGSPPDMVHGTPSHGGPEPACPGALPAGQLINGCSRKSRTKKFGALDPQRLKISNLIIIQADGLGNMHFHPAALRANGLFAPTRAAGPFRPLFAPPAVGRPSSALVMGGAGVAVPVAGAVLFDAGAVVARHAKASFPISVPV